MGKKLVRWCVLTVLWVLLWNAGSADTPYREHGFFRWRDDDGGTVWLQRLSRGASQPVGDVCGDMPKVSYVTDFLFDPLDDENWAISTESEAGHVLWRGLWGVRPLHIWGVWSNVGCKELMGFGTAWLAGIYQRMSIWVTVAHNIEGVGEDNVWGKQIMTNWFIQDKDGNFRELQLVGCGGAGITRYCVLVSGYIGGTMALSLSEDYIEPYVRLGEPVYVYGCVPDIREVQRMTEYEVGFICSVHTGIVNSAHSSRRFIGGGDFEMSALATGGFSGAPVMAYRDGRFVVVGVVNGGVRGFITSVYFVDADVITKTIEWLKGGHNLFRPGPAESDADKR